MRSPHAGDVTKSPFLRGNGCHAPSHVTKSLTLRGDGNPQQNHWSQSCHSECLDWLSEKLTLRAHFGSPCVHIFKKWRSGVQSPASCSFACENNNLETFKLRDTAWPLCQWLDNVPVVAQQALTKDNLDVLAGGPHRSSNCPGLFPSENVTPGHYAAPADFLFEVVGLEGHRLMLEVSGGCDTMLMVSANGHRFYDDDDAGDFQPQITLTRPRSGVYHVWVGTDEPDTCDAMLTIRAVPQ